MKKRILAILLACMMVITAIPFSVFAESEECSHLQEDGSHRKSAMSEGDYEQVGDVVAPTCSEIGYTTYKCLECGAYFVDDVKAKDANNHVDTKEVAAVAPTCTKVGYTAGVRCLDCNKVFSGCKEIKALGHEWIDTPLDNDKYCGGKICSRCGTPATGKDAPESAHVWGDLVIKVEPTYETKGEAVRSCKNCDATQTVVIEKQCFHDLEEVKAVKPTYCSEGNQTVAAGVLAHYHCSLCGKNFTDATAATEMDDIVDDEKLHIMTEVGEDSTCEKYGLKYKMCERCGYVDEKTVTPIPPRAHTTYKEAKDAKLVGSYSDNGHDSLGWVAPSCEKAGHFEWACEMCGDTCEFVPTYSKGDKKGKPLEAATGHSNKGKGTTVTVPGTCTNVGYTYTYCTNGNCDHAEISTYKVGDKTYAVAAKLDSATKKPTGAAVKVFEFTVGAKDATFHDRLLIETTSDDYNAPTCTKSGSQLIYCTECDVEVWETLPALGHAWPKDSKGKDKWTTIPACSNEDGYTQMRECGRCDATEYKNVVEVVTGDVIHEYDDAVKMHGAFKKDADGNVIKVILKAGSCTEKGVAQYTCSACDAYVLAYIENTGAHIIPESFLKTPSCQRGETFHCAQCDKDIESGDYATDCDKKVVVEAKDPTCAAYGYLKVEYCSICKIFTVYNEDGTVKTTYAQSSAKDAKYDKALENVKGKDYARVDKLPHDHEIVSKAVAPTCTNTGMYPIYECSECGYKTYYESGKHEKYDAKKAVIPALGHLYQKDENGNVIGAVTDSKGNIIEGHVDSIYDIVVPVSATCHSYGYTYSSCSRCGIEHINNVEEFTAHNIPGKDDDNNVLAKAPTCTDSGYTAHKKCADCNYTVGKEVIPATGHKNAAGEIFYADCTKYDDVEDHKCVTCDKEIDIKHAKKQKQDTIKPTCTEAGYTIWYCPACNEYTPDDVVEANGHSWEDEADWEYVEATESEVAHYIAECTVDGCDATKKVEVSDLALHIELANANGQKGFTDSSLVNVSIMISGKNAAAAGVSFSLNYDAADLVYVEGSATFGNLFNAANGDNCLVNDIKKTVEKVEVSTGEIRVLATRANALGLEEAEVDGVYTLVTLQFRIKNTVDDAENKVDDYSAYLNFENVVALDADNESVECDTTNETLDFVKFMNYVDNGTEVTLADAFAAYQMVTGTLSYVDDKDTKDEDDDETIYITYDVSLDVNKDGVVAGDDVYAIYQYIVGILSYEDMLALGTK